MKGIIYYTDNRLDEEISAKVKEKILESGLPIVSVSLQPMDFGKNIVLNLAPGPVTMLEQILVALKESEAELVFFCEHDVLYNSTHFDFIPAKNNVFYYNTNVWRWNYRSKKVITYDHLISLSGLCAYRQKAIAHYEKKLKIVYENGYNTLPTKGNPNWARRMGYEPGKPVRNGGIADDPIEEWRSKYPNIDIRHSKTMTPVKMTLESFVHKPTGWKESTIDKLPGWDLKEISLK